jgi:hypothetical protein
MIPVRRSLLEQTAKKIEKLKGIKWSKALDAAATEFGFTNYRHYQNAYKNSKWKTCAEPGPVELDKKTKFLKLVNESSDLEISTFCHENDVEKDVINYLLHLFEIRKITVPGKLFFKFEDFEFDFKDFNYKSRNDRIEVRGEFFINVKTFHGKEFEYNGASKSSRNFLSSFLVCIGVDGMILETANITDEPFRSSFSL